MIDHIARGRAWIFHAYRLLIAHTLGAPFVGGGEASKSHLFSCTGLCNGEEILSASASVCGLQIVRH
jgi:hypothetical protein